MDLGARAQTFLGRLGNEAPIGLAALDRDLRFVAVNARMAELNATPIAEHLGRRLHDVMPHVADQIEPHVRGVFATSEPALGIEVRARDETNAWRWAEASYFPIVEDGAVIAVGRAMLDTTDRMNALRRLLLLQDAVGAIAANSEPLAAISEIADRALASVDAQGAAAGVVSDDGRWLELVAAAGPLGSTLLAEYPRIPLDAHAPAGVAFRERRMVWVPTRADWEREYPNGSHLIAVGARSSLALPMEVAHTGRCLGVLGLLWDHEPDLAASDLDLIATFAHQATEALERIVLLDSERRAREQFELLATLGARVDAGLTLNTRIAAFFDVLVPAFADFALVEVQNEGEHAPAYEVHVRHVDPTQEPLLVRFRELRRDTSSELSLSAAIANNEAALLGADLLPDPTGVDAETRHAASELGISSAALVPIVARSNVFGGVAVGRRRGREPFTPAEFALASELAGRLGVALENARLYERERQIAETLQHSLLPDHIPDIPGIQCWARYLPGTDLAVGGDFWDVVALPAGRVLLVVGDVAGRGERAAITMGRLRTVLRASVHQERSPASLTTALNRFLIEDEHEMATCVCAILDPAEQTLTVASAGHLPLLRVTASGEAKLVGGATGVPLGVRPYAAFGEDVLTVAAGDTLVFFTDGLIERRDTSIDDRLTVFVDVATRAIVSAGDAWCDRIVEDMIGATRDDDVAVLGVRLAAGPETLTVRVPADLARLRQLRGEVRAWLAANSVDPDSVEALCLAIGEATANVAMHAYGPGGGELRVDGVIHGSTVRVQIEDDGHWRAPLDDLGRGMRIIEELADTVSVERRADGTTVVLTRRFVR